MGRKVDNLCLPDGKPHPEAARFFGVRLHEWLEATRLSQQALSTKLSVDKAYVSRMVNGKQSPSLSILAGIVVALYLAFKQKKDLIWRATEVREVAKMLGYGWGQVRDEIANALQGHISEVRDEVLTWWDSARPRLARTELPSTPANLVARAEFADLKARVLETEDGWNARWPVIILGGATGVGKTTLATEIARSPEIRACFSNGVVWVRGEEEEVEQALESACWQVGVRRLRRTQWTTTWREWLALPERRVLVILDDVDKKHLAILRELTASLNSRSVLLITTQVPDEVRKKALNFLNREQSKRPVQDLVNNLPLSGFNPEEGLAFLCRLFKEYTCQYIPSREMWEHIGKKVHWHPLALRLTVARGCEVGWKQALAELEEGLTGRYEELREMVRRNIERLPGEERARLQTLIKYMKYGDAFGVKYAAAVWEMEEEEALIRIRRLARLGLVEEVKGYPLGLGLGKQWWRVIPIVFALYHESHNDTWRMINCRFAARRMARQRAPHLRPHPLFVILVAVWNVSLLVEWMIAKIIRTAEKVAGPLGWEERWARLTLINRAATQMKALWRKKGVFPPEEYWLLDARADFISAVLLGTAIAWSSSAFFVPRWLMGLPVVAGLVLFLVWVAVVPLIWLAVASSVSWLWWMAYLMGVEALDLRILISVTRKLTGHPGMEPIRFEDYTPSSGSVPDECEGL